MRGSLLAGGPATFRIFISIPLIQVLILSTAASSDCFSASRCGNQRPGVTPYFALVDNLPQAIQKIISIILITKDFSALYTARDPAMQRLWGFYS
jgi:hypothetical protein